jgi:hypothetical protein
VRRPGVGGGRGGGRTGFVVVTGVASGGVADVEAGGVGGVGAWAMEGGEGGREEGGVMLTMAVVSGCGAVVT